MYFYYLIEKFCCVKKSIINKKRRKLHPLKIRINRKLTPQLKTLRVQGCRKYKRNENLKGNKSTFLSTSVNKENLEGSVTIEAALVLPLFVYAILVFFSFFIIINYQTIMQNSVNNAAKAVSRYEYLNERLEKISEKKEISEKITYDKDILEQGINNLYIRKKILNDEVKNYTKKINIVRGISGIEINETEINKSNDGINDIKVYYRLEVWKLGKSRGRLSLGNRCYFRSWIGESICETDVSDSKKVFITKNGKVYHLYKDCTHIELSVEKVKYEEVGQLRNLYGGKYYKCEKCIKKQLPYGYFVYITKSGDSYHSYEKCSAIIRDVIEVDISDVGDRDICNRCSKRLNGM